MKIIEIRGLHLSSEEDQMSICRREGTEGVGVSLSRRLSRDVPLVPAAAEEIATGNEAAGMLESRQRRGGDYCDLTGRSRGSLKLIRCQILVEQNFDPNLHFEFPSGFPQWRQ